MRPGNTRRHLGLAMLRQLFSVGEIRGRGGWMELNLDDGTGKGEHPEQMWQHGDVAMSSIEVLQPVDQRGPRQ